jgi:hypothetical protein
MRYKPKASLSDFSRVWAKNPMMKTLRNLASLMWSKIKITLNLAAENIALRQQLTVMKRTNKRPKIRMTDRLLSVKPANKLKRQWLAVDDLSKRMRRHLRPLFMALNFSSVKPDNPWLMALAWAKGVFAKQQRLSQRAIAECPPASLPKRLRPYLLIFDADGKPTGVHPDRYEFWLYRQIRKWPTYSASSTMSADSYLPSRRCSRAMLRSAFLRFFSTHQARSSNPLGSNSKLFADFVKGDVFLAFFSVQQSFFHRFTFEKIGRLLLGLNLIPQVNGDNDTGNLVVLIGYVLKLTHDRPSCLIAVLHLEAVSSAWHRVL